MACTYRCDKACGCGCCSQGELASRGPRSMTLRDQVSSWGLSLPAAARPPAGGGENDVGGTGPGRRNIWTAMHAMRSRAIPVCVILLRTVVW